MQKSLLSTGSVALATVILFGATAHLIAGQNNMWYDEMQRQMDQADARAAQEQRMRTSQGKRQIKSEGEVMQKNLRHSRGRLPVTHCCLMQRRCSWWRLSAHCSCSSGIRRLCSQESVVKKSHEKPLSLRHYAASSRTNRLRFRQAPA